jgi:hypothetical protein
MKRLLIAAALAATAAMTFTPPQAEARGRGFSGHVGFGGGFNRHRGFYAPVVYSAGPTYCRWYRSPYGPVKRCFY